MPQEKMLQRDTHPQSKTPIKAPMSGGEPSNENSGKPAGRSTDRHAGNAQRQKAYRERMRQAAAAQMAAKGLPSLPVIPTIPGERRWLLALSQAQSLTRMVGAEMQSYYHDRSSDWQEGERGEEFQERMDAVQELLESFDDLLVEGTAASTVKR